MSATVAETVWYQEDSASPLTVAKPASFGAGQMLVVALIQHNNPSAQSDLGTPAGWTFQGALDGTVADGKVFSYTFTGSDPASWDFPYKSTADVVAGLFRITGADVITPTVVVSTTPASVSSPMDSPSVTPTGTDDLLLALISDICNGTVLAAAFPAGMTDLGLGEVTGHFMSSRAAYQQLSSGSATGVRTWTSVSPTGIEGGTWSIAIKSAASGGTVVTPGPLVIANPWRPAPTARILLRSTLQDPPVLTTPAPIVVASPRRSSAALVVVGRSSLVDDSVLTTPGPLVVAQPIRPRPTVVLLFRSSLEDAAPAAMTTPQPITVVPQPKPRAGVATLIRSALADAATPAPIIVTTPGRRPAPNLVLLRGVLADDPLLTTPTAIVVAAQRFRSPGRVAVLATPLEGVESTECIVHRPDTGTIGRGSAGTVTRPYTGIVEHCSCCT
jgi:hypothetical protein